MAGLGQLFHSEREKAKVEAPQTPSISQHMHHGALVFARDDLFGKHREHCLCWSCDRLKPGQPDNCPIARQVYETCVKFNLVTPVFECPEFLPKVQA